MQDQTSVLEELEKSFRQGDSAKREIIVQRISDLLVGGYESYSEQQIELFGEVLARLVDEIATAAKALLSRRLCSAPGGPYGLLRKLSLDEAIEVSGPLLSGFAPLDESILVECALEKGQDHLLALSRRQPLSSAVTEPLVDRGAPQILESVAKNKGAEFTERSFLTLVERSSGNDELARAMAVRADIPRHHFLKLMRIASDVVRRELAASNPLDTYGIGQTVTSAAETIITRTIDESVRYNEALVRVQKLHSVGRLGDLELLRFAQSKQLEHALAALAMLSGLSLKDVETTFRRERFEGLLMLVRALGLGWPTAKALLNIQAGIAGLPQAKVERALTIFEGIDSDTAKKTLMLKRRSMN